MNRNVSTRVLTVPARTARPAGTRPVAPRFQPRKKSIVGRLIRWTIFLGILGAIAASFFVTASDGKTYADLYTVPAATWAYRFVKDKISPAEEEEVETPKKPAAPSELDVKFDDAVAQRKKAESATPPADDAVAYLEKELDASAKRIDVVREVGVAASKPAPRKTKVDAVVAMDELAAQAATQKKLSAALAKHQSEISVKAALAAVPPPPPPPPPPPAPPAIVHYDLKKFHAWPSQPAGTWVRWKNGAGVEDQVLATLTDEAAVVRVETPTGVAERVFVFGADKAVVLREESLKVGDAEIACRVVQSGATLRWIPKDGPAADRVALKMQTGDQTTVVTELGEEEILVKGESKKCLKVTTGDVTVWGHADVPGFAVRIGTSEVVDWGADPSTRPAIAKKPAPEAHPEKAALAEAERLRVEGWALLEEVLEAMKDGAESQKKLKTLYLKLESSIAFLTRSRDLFLSVKIKAADPAALDETVALVGRILDIAERRSEAIKVRLTE